MLPSRVTLAPIMKKPLTNYAFIDSQSVNLQVRALGWRLKGNVDADLVLQAMIDYNEYDRAVIATSDGDFYSLVKYLYRTQKLELVLSPSRRSCSSLLKKTARERLQFMDRLRQRLEYIPKKK